jgi:hypothetical protein
VATSISSFGQSNTVLVQDGIQATSNVNMIPVQTKTVSGNIVVPPGFILVGKGVGSSCGTNIKGYFYFTDDKSKETSFSYVTPVLSDPIWLSVGAVSDFSTIITRKTGISPDAKDVNLVLPKPIEIISPERSFLTINPITTRFTWSSSDLGIEQISIRSLSNTESLIVLIETPYTNINLPDLSPLGYSYTKDAAYTWEVSESTDFPSVNEALSGVRRDYVNDHSISYTRGGNFRILP